MEAGMTLMALAITTRVQKSGVDSMFQGWQNQNHTVPSKRVFWCETVKVPVLPHLEVELATFSKTCQGL